MSLRQSPTIAQNVAASGPRHESHPRYQRGDFRRLLRGAPLKILRAWRDGQLELVVTDDILAEYDEIANRLHIRYPAVDFHPWIDFIRENAIRQEVPKPYPSVCEDPDDDIFVACALAADAKVVCSGDRHLLVIDGHQGIEILAPRQFAEKYL